MTLQAPEKRRQGNVKQAAQRKAVTGAETET